jgi:hypothetical protein
VSGIFGGVVLFAPASLTSMFVYFALFEEFGALDALYPFQIDPLRVFVFDYVYN